MTATASIVFSSFSSAADPMPRAWIRFRDQLTLSQPPASDHPLEPESGPVCVWRLLASNNRELGRSAVLYTSFDEARSAVFAARMEPDDWDVLSVHGPNAGTHGWFASASQSFPILTCGRWYGAHSASVEAARHSLEAFHDATVLAEAHRRLSPDRRRSVRQAAVAKPDAMSIPGTRTAHGSLG